MTRISVIVPVYGVQEFLRACLDSVLAQTHRDVEVVTVDDASPDGSGAILDEYAERDPRVVVVHKDANEGAGAARNTGVGRASGDYLLFLDGDDTCADGALAALAARVDELGGPEIVLVDHARLDPSGGRRGSGGEDLLRAAGDELFAPADRPEYLRAFTLVCDRAFRRDFYTGNDFAFPEGLYEDDVVAYRSMLTAKQVGCLPHVVGQYLQRESGSAMAGRGRAHFAILTQYDDVFGFLGERPELDRIRPHVFEHLVDRMIYLLGDDSRIGPAERPEFFRLAHAAYLRHRPAGFVPPVGGKGLRHRLLARGSYPAYRAVAAAGTTRKRVNGMLRPPGRHRVA